MILKGGVTYNRYKNFDKNKDYDILIFGSSRANRGINPAIFEKHGLSCYNLGTDDQTPVNSRVLIEDYVKKGKCKVVILDLFDRVFTQSPMESNLDIIQNIDQTSTAFKMMRNSFDVRTLNSFAVRVALSGSAPNYQRFDSLYKGFRSINSEKFELKIYRYKYVTNPNNALELERIINYLNANGVKLILVSQPMIFHYYGSYHQLMLKEVRPVIEKYNIDWIDFTNSVEMQNIAYFKDDCHLNVLGANTYTQILYDSLVLSNPDWVN